MPAPKGHPRWGNPLNTKKYTPEELWEKSVEYFDWVNNNPLLKEDYVGKDADRVLRQIPRCMSIERLCIFININAQTFYNYEKDETYLDVCSHIRKIIDADHFEGGMAGIYNANIVTRKLGLKEQTDLTTNDESIFTPIIIKPVND